MQKEIIGHSMTEGKSHEDANWLDLESMARVQLTSEGPSFPIENALGTNPERNELGWRAATPGPQTIALIFTVPTHLRRIFLHFIEHEAERMQEFVLRYSSATEKEPRDRAPAMDFQSHRIVAGDRRLRRQPGRCDAA